jgi:hypothetical protein
VDDTEQIRDLGAVAGSLVRRLSLVVVIGLLLFSFGLSGWPDLSILALDLGWKLFGVY